MSAVVQWILDAKVSADQMRRALEALNMLPPEHRRDLAARAICLIRLFGGPGRDQIGPLIAAVDCRFQALARLADRPEFRNWSRPGEDGAAQIAPAVLDAAATQPLIEIDGRPEFDADSFFKRLLSMTEEEGRG